MSDLISVENIRTACLKLLENNDPSKATEIDALMKKNKGSENSLLQTLCTKYKQPYVKIEPVPIKDAYSVGDKLGTGGFAVVRKCKRRTDNKIFAVKVINKKNLQKNDLVILESEVSIMRQIHHENIVKLYDVFDGKDKMCLILDLLEGGELFDRIIEQGHFSEKDAATSFGQMVSALEYLHSLHIVHRDLKPENLLFVSKQKGAAMKLIDFGLAGSCRVHPLKTPCGTPNYVAPEILQKKEYGTQVDMWSSGVILYIILCGFPPFYDENDDLKNLYGKIKNAQYEMPSPYWDPISDGAKDLVSKLLVADPAKRLTAKETMKHSWLKQASDKALGADQLLNIKRFQYIRRLRRGVRCILAVLRLIESLNQEKDKK